MSKATHLLTGLKASLAFGAIAISLAANAVTWSTVPYGAKDSSVPITMLAAGRDHRLFYEAYNDASDVDGDGTLDVGFKPYIKYYGLFDSDVCYAYQEGDGGLFRPTDSAKTRVLTIAGKEKTGYGYCHESTGGKYSGNWMNWMTTSRIDALRKVLYGGKRSTDTDTQTILERAYIPQDAHSWGKEYTSEAVNGYDISEFTPWSKPSSGDRHFFGNLTNTAGRDCGVLTNCTNRRPLLRVRRNVPSPARIWNWASRERPVLADNLDGGFDWGNGEQNFGVRVEVCTSDFHANGCTLYPNDQYKPTGVLHEYGADDSMYFGLFMGSYDNNMSGGRLRRNIASFASEFDATTGIFNASAPIVNNFNALVIRDFNNNRTNNSYRGGWETDAPMAEGDFRDWGNPVGEMLYEVTRYFAGKKEPTSAFTSAGSTVDNQVGLTTEAWLDPYKDVNDAIAACSNTSVLTISDVNVSFDSDKVPGHYQFKEFNGSTQSAFAGDISGLNASTVLDAVGAAEKIDFSTLANKKSYFVGQSQDVSDNAPTPKTVTSLASIRGLAPEEPTKQGSYYSAAMAYYSKSTDLRPEAGMEGKQTLDHFVVALSSPLPRMIVPFTDGSKITVVPFAKSVWGPAGYQISPDKGEFQPTNQIVDFYVEQIANSGTADFDASINDGRFQAEFRINYEDVEQGADHDMDVIAKYILKVVENSDGDEELVITAEATFQAGGIQQNFGYVVSGSSQDGVYLVGSDEASTPAYYLNVPEGEAPGFCDVDPDPMPATCGDLPARWEDPAEFRFTPGSTASGEYLKDPLWLAAKYGGFLDTNSLSSDTPLPDKTSEWDADEDGVPDTYFLVQNPTKLEASLKKAFADIIARSGAGSSVTASTGSLETDTLLYQAVFSTQRWSGELNAYALTDPITKERLAFGEEILKWSVSDKLPAHGDRKIYFAQYDTNDTAGDLTDDTIYAFSLKRTELSDAEKAYFPGDTDTNSPLLNYLRGDQTKEGTAPTDFRVRDTGNVLGDIAHSSPYFVEDTETIYVGANDGMLHAFNGSSGTDGGKEVFAFVPAVNLPRLNALASQDYNANHQYFVDGDVAVSSHAQTEDENHLVALLGRGGKGLFGLDVTDPSAFGKESVNWEYTIATPAGAADNDLGYMLGEPIIAQMKNDRWAVIVGNGYNSNSGKSAVYVFDLKDGTVLAKMVTDAAGDNGMATPTVVKDNNGKVETIYAGDLLGNVWKFDVSSSNPTAWDDDGNRQKFFVAKDEDGNRQPITSSIETAVNNIPADVNYNKRFLFFGTGSLFRISDPADRSVQTFYGLIDAGSAIPETDGRDDLVERTIAINSVLSDGTKTREFSTAEENDMKDKSGYFLDLTSPYEGERVIERPAYVQLREPTLIFASAVPFEDICRPGGTGFQNAVQAFSGARPNFTVFDINRDGNWDSEGSDGDHPSSYETSGIPTGNLILKPQLRFQDSNGNLQGSDLNYGAPAFKGRLSWREIVTE
jgi:type IV pilus assembly protein PilY1